MKEKDFLSGGLEIRQKPWNETPCSECSKSHCCNNLPLLPLRLESRTDFINLTMASCYHNIFPALKKSGEWTVYLGRECRFLNKTDGKCGIFGSPQQSLICKSYDAHNCWYLDAFAPKRYTTMIPFNTEMMIWYEKRYKLTENRFNVSADWDSLCDAADDFRGGALDLQPRTFVPEASYVLPFKKCHSEQYLFFPPYNRPENLNHFELITFRLGFPGLYLAVSDTCWAFMAKTDINRLHMDRFRQEYFPGIGHSDGAYSFEAMSKLQQPFSHSGEQWVVLDISDLELLKGLTVFDSEGRVRRLPTTSEILDSVNTRRPDRAA